MNAKAKIAVVTGGSEGLGFALARELGRRGFTPVLLARRQDALDRAIATLKAEGITAQAWSADVTNAARLKQVANELREQFGSISFLVSNAGVLHPGTIAELDTMKLDEMLDVNLRGAVRVTKAFLPLVADGGTILFVASGFGLMGPAGYACYAAAKAGVLTFAEALRREVHHRRIKVYAAAPSDIDTSGFRRELAEKPAWMSIAGARGTVQSADRVARKILRRCTGGRFLILTDWSVWTLHICTKLLPRWFRDILINHFFPRPPQEAR